MTEQSIQELERSKLEKLSITDLIELGMNTQEEINLLIQRLNLIKYILRNNLIENDAKSFLHPEIECKGKFKENSFNYEALRPLLEVLSPIQLEEFGYSPEITEIKEVTTKEKWDMRKAKGLSAIGGEFKSIIERATMPGDMYDITFKRK